MSERFEPGRDDAGLPDVGGMGGAGGGQVFSAKPGKIPDVMAAAVRGRTAEPIVDVAFESAGRRRLRVETVDLRDEEHGGLAWDVRAVDETARGGGTLPVRPMVGGAAVAALVVAAALGLRQYAQTGPAPAQAADAAPPAQQVADDRAAPASAAVKEVPDVVAPATPARARVTFGTYPSQADAEAIAFELWTHDVDAEVVKADGAGWVARTAGGWDRGDPAIGELVGRCRDLLLPAEVVAIE